MYIFLSYSFIYVIIILIDDKQEILIFIQIDIAMIDHIYSIIFKF